MSNAGARASDQGGLNHGGGHICRCLLIRIMIPVCCQAGYSLGCGPKPPRGWGSGSAMSTHSEPGSLPLLPRDGDDFVRMSGALRQIRSGLDRVWDRSRPLRDLVTSKGESAFAVLPSRASDSRTQVNGNLTTMSSWEACEWRPGNRPVRPGPPTCPHAQGDSSRGMDQPASVRWGSETNGMFHSGIGEAIQVPSRRTSVSNTAG